MNSQLGLTSLLFFLLAAKVHCRSSGAPCDVLDNPDLRPNHDVPPSTSAPPFRLVVTDESGDEHTRPIVRYGKKYKVKIDYDENAVQLDGFLLRAMDGLRKDVGKFTEIPSCAKLETACEKGQYITHAAAGGCSKPEFVWTTDGNTKSKAIFRFQLTAVKEFDSYWTGIKSRQFIVLGKPENAGDSLQRDETTSSDASPTQQSGPNDVPKTQKPDSQTTSQQPSTKSEQPKPGQPDENSNGGQTENKNNNNNNKQGTSAENGGKPGESKTAGKTTDDRSQKTGNPLPKEAPKPTEQPIPTPAFDPKCGDEDGPDCVFQLKRDRARSFCRIEGWPEYCPQLCCQR